MASPIRQPLSGARGQLRSLGVTVNVVGIGTRAGAPLSQAGGGFAENQGRISLARLDVAGLQQLAASGAGRYVELDQLPSLIGDLQALRRPRTGEARAREAFAGRTLAGRRDLAAAALAGGDGLARPAGVAVMSGLLFGWPAVFGPTPRRRAADWDSVWRNADQRGEQLLQQGNAAERPRRPSAIRATRPTPNCRQAKYADAARRLRRLRRRRRPLQPRQCAGARGPSAGGDQGLRRRPGARPEQSRCAPQPRPGGAGIAEAAAQSQASSNGKFPIRQRRKQRQAPGQRPDREPADPASRARAIRPRPRRIRQARRSRPTPGKTGTKAMPTRAAAVSAAPGNSQAMERSSRPRPVKHARPASRSISKTRKPKVAERRSPGPKRCGGEPGQAAAGTAARARLHSAQRTATGAGPMAAPHPGRPRRIVAAQIHDRAHDPTAREASHEEHPMPPPHHLVACRSLSLRASAASMPGWTRTRSARANRCNSPCSTMARPTASRISARSSRISTCSAAAPVPASRSSTAGCRRRSRSRWPWRPGTAASCMVPPLQWDGQSTPALALTVSGNGAAAPPGNVAASRHASHVFITATLGPAAALRAGGGSLTVRLYVDEPLYQASLELQPEQRCTDPAAWARTARPASCATAAPIA